MRLSIDGPEVNGVHVPPAYGVIPMRTNVGVLDRVLRITVGLSLIFLYALGEIGPWGMLGAVPLATACCDCVPCIPSSASAPARDRAACPDRRSTVSINSATGLTCVLCAKPRFGRLRSRPNRQSARCSM